MSDEKKQRFDAAVKRAARDPERLRSNYARLQCLFCSFAGTKEELIAHSGACEEHPLWIKFTEMLANRDYWQNMAMNRGTEASNQVVSQAEMLSACRAHVAAMEEDRRALEAQLAEHAKVIAYIDAEDKGYEAMFSRIAKALGVDTSCITTFDRMAGECERAVAKLRGELEGTRKYMEHAGQVLRQREAMVDGLTKKLVSILSAVQPGPFIANGCKYEFDPPEDILREHWKALSSAIRAAIAQEAASEEHG